MSAFQEDTRQGLARPQKKTPPKYFYDEKGSSLFERICDLPEYYVTHTEEKILAQNIGLIASRLAGRKSLVELGSGSSRKTRLLLDSCAELRTYVPVDISADFLLQEAGKIEAEYARLKVIPVCADFTLPFSLPAECGSDPRRVAAFFPGSTIGNFEPKEALRLFRSLSRLLEGGGRLLLGVDLVKDPAVLEAAYDDSSRVTAAFNLNLLGRMNRELGANFDLRAFAHRAFFNTEESRIEMHLVSLKDQLVRIGEDMFAFREGESIHTESSYKYEPARFEALVEEAGFGVVDRWTDERGYFAVYLIGA